MFPKRNALLAGMLFVLLFTAACGGAAATEAPGLPEVTGQDVIELPAATEAPAERFEPEAPSYEPEALPSDQNPVFPSHGVPPSSREPYDMFFEDYGVNPSIDTEDDNLSTFALDVDTGSYTIMRNYLREGNLPPGDSVRVEEYVNYFRQGYPNPPGHQAFEISIDGAPSPFTETERYQIMRVGIQGYQVPKFERKDAALTFVIDVSGSMDMDNRLGLVKRSLELLVEQLHPGDTVSIVVYGSDARVILEPTPGSD
ncbi:MAG TPA: von Willebrand factor type A domain-containing protein, partial [Anaerolineales bacterium]|nr:von Willebrand factor type A domain-containing protein [Anaerolineales bacterium]